MENKKDEPNKNKKKPSKNEKQQTTKINENNKNFTNKSFSLSLIEILNLYTPPYELAPIMRIPMRTGTGTDGRFPGRTDDSRDGFFEEKT